MEKMKYVKYQFRNERVHVQICMSVSIFKSKLEETALEMKKELIIFEEISKEEYERLHSLMCISHWMFKHKLTLEDVSLYVENGCTL